MISNKDNYATYRRLPFRGRGPLVARREFELGGDVYKPGDEFPWEQRVSAWKALMLWKARYVDVPAPARASAEPPKQSERKPKARGRKRKAVSDAPNGV